MYITFQIRVLMEKVIYWKCYFLIRERLPCGKSQADNAQWQTDRVYILYIKKTVLRYYLHKMLKYTPFLFA